MKGAMYCTIVLAVTLVEIQCSQSTSISYSSLLDTAEGMQDWLVKTRR